ncbi:MAG TPA: M48 family metallopeptidase [Burkholderiales bacterium]
MNFFEHQQRARRRTWLLAALFTAATAATLLLANGVVLAVVAAYAGDLHEAATLAQWIAARPGTVVGTSFSTLAVVGGASMYRMASLARGGGAVARALGGVYVDSETRDPRQRQLLNVVEEMAIAAGVPVPDVYVLEQEGGINAFAAGFTASDAAIAVTRGALEFLTRDELQGVIAHEFSHILNGDMRLNTRLIGVVYGLVFIGLTGRMILRGLAHVRGSSRHGGALAAVGAAGLALTAIGYLGTFFGAVIRAAVSRQREYLADASAVQFTRNTQGIAGALKKIAASPLRAVLQAATAEEIAHMLIADGRKMFAGFFATHPPILKRIKAIDPRFDPAELAHITLAPLAPAVEEARAAAGARAGQDRISPALLLTSIGALNEGGIEAAARTRGEIPDSLRRVARSPALAPALVLALALSREPPERSRQLARLAGRLPEGLAPHLEAVATMAASLDAAHRLALVELAFPALRRRSPAELGELVAAVEEISRIDGRFDALDYALTRLLRVHLTEAAAPQSAAPMRRPKLHSLRAEAALLFAVVARAGERDRHAAHRAFEAGMRTLLGSPVPPFAVPEPWTAPLDRALARLDALAPEAKRALIEALIVTILHDRELRLAEAELLRAVCANLHCPVPPIAPPAGGNARTAAA